MSENNCVMCGDEVTSEDIGDWISMNEPFSLYPVMCPDCYDTFSRMDTMEQLDFLMQVGV